MAVVCIVVLSFVLGVSSGNKILDEHTFLTYRHISKEDGLVTCVVTTLRKYYKKQLITIVDMNYDEDHVLKALHSMGFLSIVYRKPRSKHYLYNKGYLVTAGNVTDFTNNFQRLTEEPPWNPRAKFIIIIRSMKESEFRTIFDILMKYRVINVVILNGEEPMIYSYNPYEDYACGRYYNRIITYGRCPATADIFPYKLTTGLRRCTMRIAIPHWPPYTVYSSEMQPGMLPRGVEQVLMDTIGDKEKFNITYVLIPTEKDDYSTIGSNMTAVGPIAMLQNNETDIIMGTMMLSPSRVRAFDFLSGHLALDDELSIIVKKASYIPVWQILYKGFDPMAWLALLLALVVFAVLLMILLRAGDKTYIIFIILKNLVLQGHPIRYRGTVKCIFIFWIWFAYLVNCFYQTSLMSHTTKLSKKPQISSYEDILEYNVKSCLTPIIAKMLQTERNYTYTYKAETGCDDILAAMKTVSETDKKFTLSEYKIFKYYSYQFYDEYGNSPFYVFKDALFKLSYCSYMTKGFPRQRRLQVLTLRLREAGLVDRYFSHQFILLKLRHRFKHREFTARFVAPWYLYSFGVVISTFTLVVENFWQHQSTWNGWFARRLR